MPAERHAEPAYEDKIGNYDIRFWYNTKTHKYHIVEDTKAEELVMSKAKAEAIIKFLEWLKSEQASMC